MFKKAIVVACLLLVLPGFSLGQVIDPSQKQHGLVFGSDNVILEALQQKAKRECQITVDRYYTLAIANGETWTQTFTNAEPFVVWIPQDWEQYCIELKYTKNGKEIYKESNLARPTVLIQGSPKGANLVITITRSPKLN